MEIRQCTQVEELEPLARQWIDEVSVEKFGLEVDLTTVYRDMQDWMQGSGIVYVAVADGEIVGMIAVFAVPSYMGPQLLAVEKYWFAKKGWPMAAVKLYLAALEWARANGCSHMLVSQSETCDRAKSAGRFMAGAGAKLFETSYIMRLN